jgi:DNA-binding FadR family transcriptional regulator
VDRPAILNRTNPYRRVLFYIPALTGLGLLNLAALLWLTRDLARIKRLSDMQQEALDRFLAVQDQFHEALLEARKNPGLAPAAQRALDELENLRPDAVGEQRDKAGLN